MPDTYNNGTGNVPRLPARVVDTLLNSAGVSDYTPRGSQLKQLRALVHGVCEELLARLPDATAADEVRCTCPSGDGSLRWPCPAHPPTMGFDIALRHLKRGERLALADWPNDQWVCLGAAHPGLAADQFWNQHTRDLAESRGGTAPVRQYFIKAENGQVQMGWVPSQAEMLAETWVVVA